MTARSDRPLSVAVVHSFYVSRNPSGENRLVENEVAALRSAGHDVTLVDVRTDDLADSPLYPVRSALRVATGRGRDPLDAIAAADPDVVHVHNLFPNLGRRWVERLERPLVATLHNFRTLCAPGTLFRDGQLCTRCPDGERFAGVRYACYRDSHVATLPIAWANRHGAGADPVLRAASRIIAFSEQSRAIHADDGVPRDHIEVWPYFLPDELDPGRGGEDGGGDGWLAVGRLTAEKGMVELARAWPAGHRLRIVGDGPLEPEVRRHAGSSVELLGRRSRAEVVELMRGATGLVVPSRCFEHGPLVYVEALAAGLPVLAVRPNVAADRVLAAGTGMAIDAFTELPVALPAAEAAFPALRQRCREVFERDHTQAAYVARATALYRSL